MKILGITLFETSTANIVSAFSKTVNKLEAHAAAQFEKANKLHARAEKLVAKGDAATTEAGTARATALKIGNIFKVE